MWLKILLCISLLLHLATPFDLGPVISGNRMASVPLGRTLGDGILDLEGICTRPGLACQNCSHVVTCVALPVGWLKVPLMECPAQQTCSVRGGGCSASPAPECSQRSLTFQHVCEQVGIFPDAFDCRKFHLCSPPEDYPPGTPADHRAAQCPRHYAYHPHTAQCSIKLQHGQCEKTPIPECRSIGQSGVLELSSNHYYICLSKRGVLYPQVFLCPHGWHFWDGFCRPEERPNATVGKEVDDDEGNKLDENANKIDEEIAVDALPETTQKPAPKAVKVQRYRIDDFFSTDRPATYAPDTFLADKYDFSHLDAQPEEDVQTFYYDESMENGFSMIN